MTKQKKSQTKKLLIIGLVLILLAGSIALYFKHRSDDQKRSQQAVNQTEETVNLAPATDEEKQASEDNKKNLPDNTETPDTTPGVKQATVTITSLDTNPVRARVDGVVEDTDSGCTATFSKGSEVFSVSSASVANVSHTLCAVRPDRTLASGSWQVVVSYKSNSAEGTSAPQTITVP